MARETDPRTVGPHIRMLLPRLSPLEARVALALLERPHFDETTPLREIAAEAGVSDAMVVKLTKKLGYPGFKALRASLARYRRLPAADLHEELSETDTGPEIARKVFRTSVQALEETLAILDPAALETAAGIVAAARQRDLYGVGGSASIGRDLAHKLLRIGIRTAMYEDSHMMLMSAALLGPGDVAIGISHSGATRAVLEPLDLARKAGAATIAITNYAHSPLAGLADVVLCSTAKGSPLLGENAAARIAQLAIVDALFAAVAQRDLAAAERHLAATMQAVTEKRLRP